MDKYLSEINKAHNSQIDFFKKKYIELAEEIKNREILFRRFENLVRDFYRASFSDTKSESGVVKATLRGALANLFLEENPKPVEKLFSKILPELLERYPEAQFDEQEFLVLYGKDMAANSILNQCQVYNEFTGGFTNGKFNFYNFN